MATELELMLFEQELTEVQGLPEAARWHLERDATVPLGLFVTLHPSRKKEDVYKARFRWRDYFNAPSLKFIKIDTGVETDPMAWPRCPGFRPSSLDTCVPWTEEGQNLHPEWAQSGRNSFPNVEKPMQYALLRLQTDMDTGYEGRGPQL